MSSSTELTKLSEVSRLEGIAIFVKGGPKTVPMALALRPSVEMEKEGLVNTRNTRNTTGGDLSQVLVLVYPSTEV